MKLPGSRKWHGVALIWRSINDGEVWNAWCGAEAMASGDKYRLSVKAAVLPKGRGASLHRARVTTVLSSVEMQWAANIKRQAYYDEATKSNNQSNELPHLHKLRADLM